MPPQVQSRSSRLAAHAVAAPEKQDASSQYIKPARQGAGIYTGDDGYLYCDGLRVDEAREQAQVGHRRSLPLKPLKPLFSSRDLYSFNAAAAWGGSRVGVAVCDAMTAKGWLQP